MEEQSFERNAEGWSYSYRLIASRVDAELTLEAGGYPQHCAKTRALGAVIARDFKV